MKIFSSDKSELMDVTAIEIKDGTLLVRCKVFGTMPVTAVLTPQEARRGLALLNLRSIWFLLTLPLRWRRRAGAAA